jgi:hypothetical protein
MLRSCVFRLVLFTFLVLGVFSPLFAADPRTGEALFVGTVGFSEGGAPCLACHGHAGTGLGLSSGYYGPDLSDLYTNFGAEGVSAVLESLPFPSMEPYYRDRPLTTQEIADLTAFFAETIEAGTIPPDRLPLRVIIALLIVAGITILAARRRMKPGVRQSLINQQRQTLS